jgi:hypothetical protein
VLHSSPPPAECASLVSTWFQLGIGKVHGIPLVELKCMSEKRRREVAALVGGTRAAAARLKSPAYGRPLLRLDP